LFGIEKRLEERKGYAMTVLPLSYLNSLTSLSHVLLHSLSYPHSLTLSLAVAGCRSAAGGRREAREQQEGGKGRACADPPHGADLGVGLPGEGGAGPLAALGGAALCGELLQSVAATLAEAADLAGRCRGPPPDGKLRTQSAIDALFGKLDLNLWDCALLVRTGMLSDASGPSPPAEADVRELLARLQIGHTEAKNRAVDGLLEAQRSDEKSVLSVLGRANVSAMVQLLTASAPVACGRGVMHLQRPAHVGGHPAAAHQAGRVRQPRRAREGRDHAAAPIRRVP